MFGLVHVIREKKMKEKQLNETVEDTYRQCFLDSLRIFFHLCSCKRRSDNRFRSNENKIGTII